jgi:S-adenosylmethionine:tRNA-ribosyltransferase-isomerase (queuine synthetase)
MYLKFIKKKIFPVIKVISILVISSAVILEIWDIQALITNSHLPNSLHPVLLIARFALSAHFAEAIIAAYYAPSKNQMPIKYGTYTFFVGTVGLLELWENNDN